MLAMPEPLADEALDTVAVNCARYMAFGDDQAETAVGEPVGPKLDNERLAPVPATGGEQRRDIGGAEPLARAIRPAPDWRVQTPSRARPFARRARITARPPRVRIRTRNPCVRLRRTTEG